MWALELTLRVNSVRSSNPTWMETKFLLVNSLKENLILRLMDYNDHRANTDLGFATFDLQALERDATQENLEQQILKSLMPTAKPTTTRPPTDFRHRPLRHSTTDLDTQQGAQEAPR